MDRSPIVAALVACLALVGCGEAPTAAPASANAADVQTNANRPDQLTRVTTTAMCGKPDDRAFALSEIAENEAINTKPDDVYSVASDIAKKGCAAPQ